MCDKQILHMNLFFHLNEELEIDKYIGILRVKIHKTCRNVQPTLTTLVFIFFCSIYLSRYYFVLYIYHFQKSCNISKKIQIYELIEHCVSKTAVTLFTTKYKILRDIMYLINIVWQMGFYHASLESPEALLKLPQARNWHIKIAWY